ncbi:TadE/TadG family type IV pilus assembly protein [Donghicola mangrovi]|uniref:Pilus assembly protein n=1 Tax=Donghicola mangrovi TaxID=2729614 RepID=A0A850QFB2_9RHOB|nr:hypothetical protein [Donghicola mangrovi]NVO24809.1 hypothetical protein [Donghicola mangrovi]
MIRALKRQLRRFRRDDRGSITLEAILYLPPLITMFMLSLVLFDAFRTNNLSQKAAYAISDAISRETTALTPAYLNGMEQLYTDIVGRRAGYGIRYTVIHWSQSKSKYIVDWSRRRGDLITNRLTTDDLEGIKDQLPTLQNGEVVIMIETRTDINVPDALRDGNGWAPPLAVRMDLDKFEMAANVITRPRFSPQICLNECG